MRRTCLFGNGRLARALAGVEAVAKLFRDLGGFIFGLDIGHEARGVWFRDN